MLLSGVSVIEAIDITGSVVDNAAYASVLADVAKDVKGGSSISDAFGKHKEMPGIIVAMVKVGEESGELGKILATMAKFYNREVSNAIDTLVGLIEPLMIVLLGLGVGILVAAVLLPIYNLAGAISRVYPQSRLPFNTINHIILTLIEYNKLCTKIVPGVLPLSNCLS